MQIKFQDLDVKRGISIPLSLLLPLIHRSSFENSFVFQLSDSLMEKIKYFFRSNDDDWNKE